MKLLAADQDLEVGYIDFVTKSSSGFFRSILFGAQSTEFATKSSDVAAQSTEFAAKSSDFAARSTEFATESSDVAAQSSEFEVRRKKIYVLKQPEGVADVVSVVI